MKKMLSIVAGVMVLCLMLTSCENYVNRVHLYGNWDCYSGPDLKIAFSMNKQFDYQKIYWEAHEDGEVAVFDDHFGNYTCTDSTFTLHCTQEHYNQTEPCKVMKFSYIMTDDGMTITDETGNQYLMH